MSKNFYVPLFMARDRTKSDEGIEKSAAAQNAFITRQDEDGTLVAGGPDPMRTGRRHARLLLVWNGWAINQKKAYRICCGMDTQLRSNTSTRRVSVKLSEDAVTQLDRVCG